MPRRKKKKREPSEIEVYEAQTICQQMADCDDPILSTPGWEDKLLPFQLTQEQIGILDRGLGKDWFDKYRLTNDDLQTIVFEPPRYSKMYILTRKRFPIGHQANCAAHAAVKCVERYKRLDSMVQWLDSSFRKVTCWVTDAQFEEAKRAGLPYVTMREDALDDKTIAMAFVPRQEWPDLFKTFPLFGERMLLVRFQQLLNWGL